MQKKNFNTTEIILSAIALVLVIMLFFKATILIDAGYDAGWYHLPFAARIWDIISSDSFTSGDKIGYRYDGFPLLAHFFQGLFWKLTGRIQSTNLVGYLSLIGYILFLKNFFEVPLYLSTIALLAIPTVLTHATTSFVDLPGNIGASIALMMTYRFFLLSRLPTQGELFFIFLGSAAAVNIKPQLQPLIFVLYCVAGCRLAWLYWSFSKHEWRRAWQIVTLAAIASALIFATPIKNIAFYNNPFYPIKVEFAGVVLNHEMTPQTYNEGNRPQRWLQSILEIGTPEWSADQWNKGDDKYLDRAGGFFGAYVVFNLLLLFSLFSSELIRNFNLSKNKKSYRILTALIIVLCLSYYAANFPQSHELRYLMCWMISLVSLNLHFISSKMHSWFHSLFYAKHFLLVYLVLFVIVFIKVSMIKYKYLDAQSFTLSQHLSRVTEPDILAQIVPDQKNCIISNYDTVVPINKVFYYSSYFHPELEAYAIEVAPYIDKCNSRIIIKPRS